MNAQKISTFLRKTGAVASLLAASAAITGSLAPSASAATLLPPSFETEIDVGLNGNGGTGCLDPNKCITASAIPFIESIVSLVDSTTGTRSRLFIDELLDDAPSIYSGGALGTAILLPKDIGTTPFGFWFRPAETNANGSVGEENSQLEVGTYTFTFKNPLSELLIRLFDIEAADQTRILAINGIPGGPILPSGSDGNIQELTLNDVKSITIKLGQDVPNGTGDGVDFQFEATETVPEPAALAGLGLVVGAMAVSRRRKATKTS